jgi:hypothetical protein
MSGEELDEHLRALRNHLAVDQSPAVVAEVKTPYVAEALSQPWWQRIAIPGTKSFSTSDPSRLAIREAQWPHDDPERKVIESSKSLRRTWDLGQHN